MKAVVFWFLMVISAVALWRVMQLGPDRWIPEGLLIAAFVVLMLWFLNRFSGSKRWPARIMVFSALCAFIAGEIAVWKFLLVRAGYGENSMLESLVAGVVFLACGCISFWAFWRLRKSAQLDVGRQL